MFLRFVVDRLAADVRKRFRRALLAADVEPEEPHVDPAPVELRDLRRELVVVPARHLLRLVVGEPQRVRLRLREVRQDDARRAFQPEPLRRLEPRVPRDDHVVAVEQDRVVEPELPDAFDDLRDRAAVVPRVVLVGVDVRERHQLDLLRRFGVHCPFLRLPRSFARPAPDVSSEIRRDGYLTATHPAKLRNRQKHSTWRKPAARSMSMFHAAVIGTRTPSRLLRFAEICSSV